MARQYSDKSFFKKITDFAKAAGFEVIECALILYFTMKKPECPAWSKTIIVGALAYFISPVDAIPDFTPGIGFVDDLGVLAAATTSVAVHIDKKVKKQACEKMDDIFGDSYTDAA